MGAPVAAPDALAAAPQVPHVFGQFLASTLENMGSVQYPPILEHAWPMTPDDFESTHGGGGGADSHGPSLNVQKSVGGPVYEGPRAPAVTCEVPAPHVDRPHWLAHAAALLAEPPPEKWRAFHRVHDTVNAPPLEYE